MFLVHEDLLLALEQRKLQLNPFDLERPEIRARVQTASIDLHLGESYAVYRNDVGMVSQQMPRRIEDIDEHSFDIRPLGLGEQVTIPPLGFMLAAVDVHLRVPDNLVVYVEGKSTIGRAGLIVQNAGFVEPGFEGVLTCELFNLAPFPLVLTSGEPLCQIAVARTTRPTAFTYGRVELGSRYQHQHRVQPPRRRRVA